MDFFQKSTHSSSLLTREQLSSLRDAMYEESRRLVLSEWLGAEECELIQKYYQLQIRTVCTFLKLPAFVQVPLHHHGPGCPL